MSEHNLYESAEFPEFDEQCTITSSVSMIRPFVPVQNSPYPCLLMDVHVPLLFCQENVNLTHWLEALKKIQSEFNDVQSSNLLLSSLSNREPYQKLKQPHEKDESCNHDEQGHDEDDFNNFLTKCQNYFGLPGECIASNGISWPPKLSMPLVSENVGIGRGPGWGFHLRVQPGHEQEADEVSKAMFVENSREFLWYYSDDNSLRQDVFKQYEQLCRHAIASLFPFPDELTDMLFEDVKNIPPHGDNPTSVWTFLLFNLAWKMHPYSKLRAKYASTAGNGQFMFSNDMAITMESVRNLNIDYLRRGAQFGPVFSGPINVKRVASVLENLFEASNDAIDLLIRRTEELLSPAQCVLNHNATITEEHRKNEKQFCDEIVKPLLNSIGYQNIRYTHGPNELGKDFIAKDSDKTSEYYVAFVVKAGDVSGGASSSVLNDIISQVDMAFSVPRKLSDGLTEVYMSKVIVVISGKFLDNAIERLRGKYEKQCQLGYLQLWDSAKVETLIKEYGV